MSVTNVTCNIGDKEIKFETGKLALQAPGSVVVNIWRYKCFSNNCC